MTIKQHTNRLKSKVTLRKIINKIKWKAKKKWDIIRFNREHHLILSSLITSQEIKNEDIILYTPTIDWNISLFQKGISGHISRICKSPEVLHGDAI